MNWRLIQISKPISLNNVYGNSKSGRRKTKEYRAWMFQTSVEIRSQSVRRVEGNYQLELHVGNKCSRADIDNLIKPISDLLVKLGITEDDAKMKRCSSEYVSDRNNVLIRIAEHRD